MKSGMDIVRNLTMLTQFGVSLIAPLLMCLGLSCFLQTKAGLGGWVFIPGFFFGLGGSAMTAWKMYLSVMKKAEKTERKQGVSFNSHE